jgi:hypothetical protein
MKIESKNGYRRFYFMRKEINIWNSIYLDSVTSIL